MSRKSKGPHLTWRKDPGTWIIRDGNTYKRTGYGKSEDATIAAEKALAQYIAGKWTPKTNSTNQHDIYLANVIMAYLEHRIDTAKRPKELKSICNRLNDFWGGMTVSDIIGKNCRAFAVQSSTQSMARHDLEILRASVGHYKREHGLDVLPAFVMPPKGASRTVWLTRKQAAVLLWAAHRAGKEHIVRFILIAIYTGTRSEALRGLQWFPNTTSGWIDVEAGVIYRKHDGEEETKKRRPPVAIPNRLLPHLRRWAEKDA